MKKTVFIALSILSILAIYLIPEAKTADDGLLRVCVLKDAEEFILTVKGPYEIHKLKEGGLIKEGRNIRKAEVFPTDNGISIAGDPLNAYGVKIVAGKRAVIYLAKRPFRGDMDIVKAKDGKLLAINHVRMDDYLKGVLYHEVSHWWPMEVLKAQAIAARTYALYQKSVRRQKDFDLTSDIYSQVYGGRRSERWTTNRAVNLTRGQALTFDGKIFPTYYHATCGGHTEDAANLWDMDLPPLNGVRSNFCKGSPHYYWTHDISISQIEEDLNRADHKVANLKYMIMQGRNDSGRLNSLKFVGDDETIVPAGDFRLAIGPNRIRSTNFDIVDRGKYFLFRGRGWGHGVGMCQWGACFLSRKRYKAKEILRHFYPGAEIKKI